MLTVRQGGLCKITATLFLFFLGGDDGMTAEIAVLNKTAVALATDSAVTISAGSDQQKIYDSADKLFDLCGDTPIGVMIYNGMQFMQAPLPMLLADYRLKRRSFTRLPDAAANLLQYLCDWGTRSPKPVEDASVASIVIAVLDAIKSRIQSKVEESFKGPFEDAVKAIRTFMDETISLFERVLSKAPDALFIDNRGKSSPPNFGVEELDIIKGIVQAQFTGERPEVIDKLIEIGRLALLKNRLSGGQTGIVVAGFGQKDIFPSLVSFEIDGMVFGRLKYVETNNVDIDRTGERAPFRSKGNGRTIPLRSGWRHRAQHKSILQIHRSSHKRSNSGQFGNVR